MQFGVRDAARALNVSEKTIYRWVKEGKLPAYRVNEQYRFNRAELLEYATSHKISVSPDLFEEPEDDVRSPLPTLEEALQAGGIHYHIGGTDKPSALRAVIDIMQLPDDVDRQFLLQVLLSREYLGSTGIGDGIAIPHVRTPIVMRIRRPMITLCFLDKGIDFDAIDGKPVEILFTIVSLTIRSHLHLLSKLAFVLRDPNFRALLGRHGMPEEIMAEVHRVERQWQKDG